MNAGSTIVDGEVVRRIAEFFLNELSG